MLSIGLCKRLSPTLPTPPLDWDTDLQCAATLEGHRSLRQKKQNLYAAQLNLCAAVNLYAAN